MKPLTRFMQAMLVLISVIGYQQAQAFYLGGSFSGTVQAQQLPLNFSPPYPESYYDGAPITGTFEINAPNLTSVSPYNEGGFLALSYTIKDTQFSYLIDGNDPANGYLPSVVQLYDSSGGQQSAMFSSGFIWKYQGASLTLTGPSGSLFYNSDPSTLYVDPNTPPTLNTDFSNAAAAMWFDVDVQHVDYRYEPAVSVPEPGTGALFITGCALLAWQRRRQLRVVKVVAPK